MWLESHAKLPSPTCSEIRFNISMPRKRMSALPESRRMSPFRAATKQSSMAWAMSAAPFCPTILPAPLREWAARIITSNWSDEAGFCSKASKPSFKMATWFWVSVRKSSHMAGSSGISSSSWGASSKGGEVISSNGSEADAGSAAGTFTDPVDVPRGPPAEKISPLFTQALISSACKSIHIGSPSEGFSDMWLRISTPSNRYWSPASSNKNSPFSAATKALFMAWERATAFSRSMICAPPLMAWIAGIIAWNLSRAVGSAASD